jgi:hypothetical protein
MKATKTFKIGEYAIGGIIKVKINGKVIQIEALDWFTKEILQTGSTMITERDARRKVNLFLNELTSFYYAGEIIEWIESKIEFKNEYDFY